MVMKYCRSCKRNVNTEHSFNLGLLAVLLFLFFLPGLIYLAWGWKRRCPICRTPQKMLDNPRFDDYVPTNSTSDAE